MGLQLIQTKIFDHWDNNSSTRDRLLGIAHPEAGPAVHSVHWDGIKANSE
jgi:hypothetical protein